MAILVLRAYTAQAPATHSAMLWISSSCRSRSKSDGICKICRCDKRHVVWDMRGAPQQSSSARDQESMARLVCGLYAHSPIERKYTMHSTKCVCAGYVAHAQASWAGRKRTNTAARARCTALSFPACGVAALWIGASYRCAALAASKISIHRRLDDDGMAPAVLTSIQSNRAQTSWCCPIFFARGQLLGSYDKEICFKVVARGTNL